MSSPNGPKTRQLNLRLDEKTLAELHDLAEVMGSTPSRALRDLIAKAHKKLTQAMLAELQRKRAMEKSAAAKILG
jgi:hypothetical protein